MHTIAVRLDRPCVIALRERENTSWNGWLNDKLKDVMGNQVLPCNGMLAPHNAAHAMKLVTSNGREYRPLSHYICSVNKTVKIWI